MNTFTTRRFFISFRRNKPPLFYRPVPPPTPPPPIRSIRDEFAYLSDLKNAKTHAYIKAENHYFNTKKLEWTHLYDNILSQLKQCTAVEDPSVFDPPPELSNGYAFFLRDGVYYKQKYSDTKQSLDSNVSARYVQDKPPYPTHTLPKFDEKKAVILLDTHAFPNGVSISNVSLSADHKLLGYVQKQVGDESGILCFKDLSGRDQGFETVGNVVNFAWMNNGKSVVYTEMNPQLRPNKVYFHSLNTSQSHDQLIYEEPDDRFFVDVSLTKDKKFVTINMNSRTTSEVYILDASVDLSMQKDKGSSQLKLIAPRKSGVEYFIDSHGDQLYIVTNAFTHSDFTLCTASLFETSTWKPLLKLDNSYKLEDVDVFHDHIVLYAKKDGLSQILVHEIPTAETHSVPLQEPICTITPGVNKDFYTDNVRFSVSNPGNLEVVYEYRFKQKSLHELRRVPVPGYHRSNYVVYRAHFDLPKELWNNSQSDDVPKTFLPVTLYHRSDVTLPGADQIFSSIQTMSGSINPRPQNKNSIVPILISSYNSYGMDASLPFDPMFQPLLDNGWIIATCHGIGGSEYGKEWCKLGQGAEGKLLAINQVSHFVNKISEHGGSHVKLSGLGISAGGCIMGSVLGKSWFKQGDRLRNKFSSFVLHVPFLDPVAAMLDPTEALTTTEYEEWGNPLKSEKDEEVMHEYSPYELIPWSPGHGKDESDHDEHLPAILITGGLLDRRVPFWHPLKFTARYRLRVGGQKTMLLIREDGGHFEDTSESSLEDLSWWLSFLLHSIQK